MKQMCGLMRCFASPTDGLKAMPAGNGFVARAWQCKVCGQWHMTRWKPDFLAYTGKPKPGPKPRGSAAPLDRYAQPGEW
jgi:hypothetical protein